MFQIRNIYRFLFPVFIALVIGSNLSCNSAKSKTDWRVNFNVKNKQPSGLYLYYNQLQHIFPYTNVTTLRKGFDFTKIYNKYSEGGITLLMFTGMQLNVSEDEVAEIIEFVRNGNEVFFSVKHIDDKILNQLLISQNPNNWNYFYDHFYKDSVQQFSIYDGEKNKINYSFKAGYSVNNYFQRLDSVTVGNQEYSNLGYLGDRPNYMVFTFGQGRIFLHAEPMLFSNVNLLHADNRNYVANALSFVSDNVENVYFVSFDYRTGSTSLLGIIFSDKSTHTAFLLALILLCLFILFSIKRKQAIIPIIPQSKNESAIFAQTVGQLYYNTGNHTNIAQKICNHFLDKVRTNYNMNINHLDKEFIHKLAIKSGNIEAEVDELIYLVKCIRDGMSVDEDILANLNHKIQVFNNGK